MIRPPGTALDRLSGERPGESNAAVRRAYYEQTLAGLHRQIAEARRSIRYLEGARDALLREAGGSRRAGEP